MAWNIATFRATFPAFSSPTVYTDAQIEAWRTMGECQLRQSPCASDGCYDMALMLLVAHIGDLLQKAAKGKGRVGQITSSAIDKVSVGFAVPPYGGAWQFWMSMTPYGLQLQGMLSACSIGGFYSPGRPEGAAFRKTYGVF